MVLRSPMVRSVAPSGVLLFWVTNSGVPLAPHSGLYYAAPSVLEEGASPRTKFVGRRAEL